MKAVLILVLLITCYFLINRSSFGENIDDILNYRDQEKDKIFMDTVKGIKNPISDIVVTSYGCFKDLDEKFFLKKLNPFNKIKTFDSAFVISNESFQQDFNQLLENIISNGFNDYVNQLKKKYNSNYKNITIQELGALALFAGYSYISVCKESTDGYLKIYFTYSPPMDKKENDLKYLSKSDSLNCGYPCSESSSSMCGSINYPNIKSPSLFAIYKVTVK